MSQRTANTQRAERNLFCAVCDKKSNMFTVRKISLHRHIQGIGEITFPAVINYRDVQIQICRECNQELDNSVIKRVEEYHLEE